MRRTTTRLGAAASATALILLSSAPAHGATISRSSATALSGSIAGSPVDISSVAATHDGRRETTTGESSPPVGVLGNQGLVNLGVLAQEATAGVGPNGSGTSAACAGVAGNGGSVVSVGDSRCIQPGAPVGLALPNLDLSDVVVIDPKSALEPLAKQLNAPLQEVLGAITKPLTEALAPLGDTGLSGTLGAVEARCSAGPEGARGTANIVDTKLSLDLAGTELVLAELPANPPPNTDVLVNLDTVVDTLLGALERNFRTVLDGRAAAVNQALEPIRDQLVDELLAQVAPQLKPLSENVAEIILNKQSSTGDSIDVTAMSLRLLPAAEQFGLDSLVNLQIGNVTCGPSDTVTEPKEPREPREEPKKPKLPDVPTKVTSGVTDAPAEDGDGAALLGLLLVLATGAGIFGYRRSMRP